MKAMAVNRGTIIVDEGLKVLFWDTTVEQILGFSSKETLTTDIEKYLPFSTLKPGLKCLTKGAHKSGTTKPLHATLSYLQHEDEHLGVIEIQTQGTMRREYDGDRTDRTRLLSIIDDLDTAAVLFRADGTIVSANALFLDKLSVTHDVVTTRKFSSFLDPRKEEEVWSEIMQIQFLESHSRYMEFRMVPDSGGTLHAGARINYRAEQNEDDVDFLAVISDRTSFYHYEMELSNRERFVRAVLQSSPIVFYIYDLKDKKAIFSNQGIGRILGYSRLGGIEIGEGFFPSLIHPDDRELINKYHSEIAESVSDEIYEIKYRVKAADDTWHWMFSRDSILKRNSQGQVLQIVGTAQDISEEVRAQEEIKALNVSLEDRVRVRTEQLHLANKELERMATTDFLTGIYNRRYFYDRSEEESQRCRRYSRSMTFLMMDIDFFKSVNDTHGHDAGDKVLKTFASVLQDSLRKTDLFGRLGGEEFGVVLIETDKNQALIVAERFRESIQNLPMDIGEEKKLNITVSIGMAESQGEIALDILVKRADEALYAAKGGGRNCVVTWNEKDFSKDKVSGDQEQ